MYSCGPEQARRGMRASTRHIRGQASDTPTRPTPWGHHPPVHRLEG